MPHDTEVDHLLQAASVLAQPLPPLPEVLLRLLTPHAHGLRAVACWQALRSPRPSYGAVLYHLRRLCRAQLLVRIGRFHYALHEDIRQARHRALFYQFLEEDPALRAAFRRTPLTPGGPDAPTP